MKAFLIITLLFGSILQAFAAADHPNVVLIVCDDLNDYVTGFGGHPQAETPNMARLADSGVAFKRAYSNNPVCAPSRSSFLTGIYAHTSGNLFWNKWFENPVLKNSKTIMEHFRDNGYHVLGSGKLMHHAKRDVWSEFGHDTDYGPFAYNGTDRVAHPSVPMPFGGNGPVDGSFAALEDVPFADDEDPTSGWIYGKWGKDVTPFHYLEDGKKDLTPDERNAVWAEKRIRDFAEDENGKPFFLAVGFIRPHTPLHVAKKYYDMFPQDEIILPVVKPGDAEDTHYKDVFDDNQKGLKYFRTLNESYPTTDAALRAFTQAYLASVKAVDDCIGQVISAIDNSGLKENTIIIVTSDHGWNMGEKDYLFKNSPWEESTRVPFIVRAPGVAKAGGVAGQPISLIDLYPTLVDLCGLEGDTRKNDEGAPLDGFSVRPFLEDPACGEWEGPEAAISMIWAGLQGDDKWNPDRQHWSLRTERWRYIRYNNGDEELYDHNNDPYEWNNLATLPEHEDLKKSLHEKMLSLRSTD
ncbi:sulfatase [Puniceicoccales bacterium CK1056]|uniref:Sulfatase n=1 Tax=Oceanipulchritudo coccoides TaxID=2706888 RepID=A0A6B2LZK5_9BACT|nr:sulfatase [Oceanipulchritudo coccoides]NDV61496.1 sulfatase [Oceanipulchritudo coccoides]